MLQDERWADVPGYKGRYAVSSLGRVRSVVRGTPRILRQHPVPKGYRVVCLFSGSGGRRLIKVHRLVLLSFVGPCPEHGVSRHLNSVPSDNRLDNLRWSTQKENLSDRIANGTHMCGERQGRHVLTNDDVRMIRALRAGGARLCDIASCLGVSHGCVSGVTSGRSWTHVESGS